MFGFEQLNENHSFLERIELLNKLISESKKVVFFGGAGVSTGSSIPDFRSENGLYNNMGEEFLEYKPEYYLASECFHHNPKMFYKFYKQYMDCRNYEPNECHHKLAELERAGKLTGIITQNIDTLHEKAGSKTVCKIHGTIDKNYCIKCFKQYDINKIFDDPNPIVRCDCGKNYNLVRPKVVLYQESLPNDELEKAYNLIMDMNPNPNDSEELQSESENNVLIVAGTSLTVYPAAGIIDSYQGKNMVIINKEPTHQDKYARIIFREDICDVFKFIKAQ